jgi:DNA-binding HxlR family transcriptional regulator
MAATGSARRTIETIGGQIGPDGSQGVHVVSGDICPIAEAARLLGDKWTLIVLRDLANGTHRFKDLAQTGEGISPSILTARLRDLEQKGLISRTSYNEIPPRVEYTLTAKGRDTLPVIEALRVYGERWLAAALAHSPPSEVRPR